MYILLQFSKTMKHAAVTELEHVLTQIAKLLKEAKATFRKNRYFTVCCFVRKTKLPLLHVHPFFYFTITVHLSSVILFN